MWDDDGIFHLSAQGIRVDADSCAFTEWGFATRYTCGGNEGGADVERVIIALDTDGRLALEW